jgi:predicted SAM-dependent methyltransferase
MGKKNLIMRKVQFGCGGNRIPGWENYDAEVDITKKLPFVDNAVNTILAEHVMEHISIHQAWNFMEECHRILVPGGNMRIAVPCVSQIFEKSDQEYYDFVARHGWGAATKKDAVRSIIFNHGHMTIWEKASLEAIVQALGFQLLSEIPEGMEDTLNHHHVIGKKINDIETIFVDCIK